MNRLRHALVRPLTVLLAVLAGPPSWPVAVAREGAAAPSAAKPKPKLTQGQPAKRAPVAKTQPKPLSAASAEQLEAAERVYYGVHQCASGPAIDVSIHPVHAGYVGVRAGKVSYVMKPVLSSTGALRLEDVKGAMLMVQIAAKSMLMDTRAGRRIADECVSDKHREAMQAAGPAPASGGLLAPTPDQPPSADATAPHAAPASAAPDAPDAPARAASSVN